MRKLAVEMDPSSKLARARRWASTPFAITFVGLQGLVVSLWVVRTPVNRLNLWVYASSLLVAALLWFLLNAARDSVFGRSRALGVTVLAVATGLLVVSNAEAHLEFGELVSAYMLQFMSGAEGGGLTPYARYAAAYLGAWRVAALAALCGLLGWVWWSGSSLPIDAGRRPAIVGLASGAFVVSSLATAALAPHHRLSLEGATLAAGIRWALSPEMGSWHRVLREEAPVASGGGGELPDVVLVINESWQKQSLSVYGADRKSMPFLESWMKEERDRFFAFDRAYANATSTLLSLPSILTGLGTYECAVELQRAPLLWQWAEAAGYSPFFASPKPYVSHGLDAFMELTSLEHFRAGTRSTDSPEGDGAVDELSAAESFTRMAAEASHGGERFLGVYTSNATHRPFRFDRRAAGGLPEAATDYERALSLVDAALAEIVRGLESEGRLDETLFILTSDHGSAQARRHVPPRASSFYEEFVNVPFLVRVPGGWTEQRRDRLQALERNRDRLVSNVDILPTLLDVMGHGPAGTGGGARALARLAGRSLIRELPEERQLVLNNTNAVRVWEHEVFGVFWDDKRFLFSDSEGARLFDLGSDPEETRDLWAQASEATRQRVVETIERHYHLKRIWSRHAAEASRRP